MLKQQEFYLVILFFFQSYHDVLVENVRLRDEVTRLKAIILSYEKCHRCLPGNMKLQWI